VDDRLPLVNHQSSAEEKIALFRSLFRGREDVYPRRFESRATGSPGTRRHARMNGCLGSVKSPAFDLFAQKLAGQVSHVLSLRGGMGKKQRQAVTATLAAIPPIDGRMLLATGKYTLFLTLLVS